jgi:hypothetical protein
MLDLFRPILESGEKRDEVVGWAVAGRYHVLQRVHEDDFSRLYIGLDITDDTTIGVRIANSKRDHGRMLEWLARAMLTTGKHAILAIGHLDQNKAMYVVLSEAALDIIRQPEKLEQEPPNLTPEAI